MANQTNKNRLLPSFLDRLIDLDPFSPTESPKSQSQVIYEMKLSLKRDLQNLLNTRWSCASWPPDYEDLDLSLINYGIPDFSGINMGSPENQQRLIQIVERAIKNFEPRLIKFSIELSEEIDNISRTLSFRVDGLLRSDPFPEQVVFDTSLDISSAEFEVKSS
ncbi:MAG: type VI secretion system baseplate subunit TssE [Planctomycetaceae bacterium]|nr:type VI secretion system baseplate subunit TssE [Planctomycetaceae bacterium]MCP4478602.1 type VI secretion system baseplate subunit TssE [Planctomycetaceae bacterium]MCP4773970.1 type VI secretion system baseplate subunit TssE [Planctomycetaceae bacterium]